MIRSRVSAALLIWALPAIAQYREPGSWLPDETAGLRKIVRALISAFDHADVLALGESHWNKLDSDLRIALVRDPELQKFVVSKNQVKRIPRGHREPNAQGYMVWVEDE